MRNYVQTLIAVADDCPVEESEVPPARGGRKTIANVQYAMVRARPHVYTQEDVIFHSWLERQDGIDRTEDEVARLREEYFSKSRACLRSSPLAKRYGWGLLFDGEGKVALCPMESSEYRDIVAGKRDDVTVIKAMRSRRASR